MDETQMNASDRTRPLIILLTDRKANDGSKMNIIPGFGFFNGTLLRSSPIHEIEKRCEERTLLHEIHFADHTGRHIVAVDPDRTGRTTAGKIQAKDHEG